MKRPYCIFFLLLIVLAISLMPTVYTSPYIGIFYYRDIKLTDKVVMNMSFYPTDPYVIPKDNRLTAVISVATGNYVDSKVSFSGYVYQLPAHLYRNGSVVFSPQIWYGDQVLYLSNSNPMDIPDALVITLKIERIDSNHVVFIVYQGLYSSRQRIYGVIGYMKNPGDYFLVGYTSHNNVLLYPLQYGVESLNNNFYGNWSITMWDMYFWNSNTDSWDYASAYTIQGSNARITYITVSNETQYYYVGIRYYENEPTYYPPSLGSVKWYKSSKYYLPSWQLVFKKS